MAGWIEAAGGFAGIIGVSIHSRQPSPMTPERAHAYRQVIHTLQEVGPSKLLAGEQDRIRYAADNLIFGEDLLADAGVQEALADVERLCRGLVDSGRWERSAAMRLADCVACCGPSHEAELEAA